MAKCRNTMTDHEEEAFEKASSIMSEHFGNFAIICMDSDDALKYDYTNYIIGKALIRETLSEMNKDDLDIIWDVEESNVEEEDEE